MNQQTQLKTDQAKVSVNARKVEEPLEANVTEGQTEQQVLVLHITRQGEGGSMEKWGGKSQFYSCCN